MPLRAARDAPRGTHRLFFARGDDAEKTAVANDRDNARHGLRFGNVDRREARRVRRRTNNAAV